MKLHRGPADALEAAAKGAGRAVLGDGALGEIARELVVGTGRTIHHGGAAALRADGVGLQRPLLGGGGSPGGDLASLPSSRPTSSAAIPFDPVHSGSYLCIQSDT